MATTVTYPLTRRSSNRATSPYNYSQTATPVGGLTYKKTSSSYVSSQTERNDKPNASQAIMGVDFYQEDSHRESGMDFDWEADNQERIMDMSLRKEELAEMSYGVEDGMENLVQIPIAPELMSRRKRSKSQLRSHASRSMGNLSTTSHDQFFLPAAPYNSQFQTEHSVSRSSSRSSSVGPSHKNKTSLAFSTRSERHGSESEVRPYFVDSSKSRLPIRSKVSMSNSEDESTSGMKGRGTQRYTNLDVAEGELDGSDGREMLEDGSEDERGSRKRLSSALDLTEFGPPQTKRKVLTVERTTTGALEGEVKSKSKAQTEHAYPPRPKPQKSVTTSSQSFPSSRSTSNPKIVAVSNESSRKRTRSSKTGVPINASTPRATKVSNQKSKPPPSVRPRTNPNISAARRRSFSTSSINPNDVAPAPFAVSPPIIYKGQATNTAEIALNGAPVKPSWDDVVLPAIARKMHREWQEEQAQKGGDALIRDWDTEGRPAGMELVIVNGKKVLRQVQKTEEPTQSIPDEYIQPHVEDNRTFVEDAASTVRERDVETPSTAFSDSLQRNRSVLRPDGQISGLGERKEIWQQGPEAIPEMSSQIRINGAQKSKEKVAEDTHEGGCCRCVIM